MIRKRHNSSKSKAIRGVVDDVLKFFQDGVEIKTWHVTETYYRLPTEQEFHDEVKHRPKFAGKTFQEYYDEHPDLHAHFPTVYELYDGFIKQEIRGGNLSFKFAIRSNNTQAMDESRVTRQLLVEDHRCSLSFHEMYLTRPSSCPPLRYDPDGAQTTRVGFIFSTQPKETSKRTDLIALFARGQSYMYCFSQAGHLRLLEFKPTCEDSSKHHHMCELDGPACCAGVMIRRVDTVYVDLLSGTYEPKAENVNAFESILRQKFPFTKFRFKKDRSYLSTEKMFADHPDY